MNKPIDFSTLPIDYPVDDGQPMSESMAQYRWIVTLVANLADLFHDDPLVLVAGDMLWYAIEGDNTTRMAADAMVVFGRPKHERPSYLQWLEDGIAPQVVFEVLSPSNRAGEMARKQQFYERFGVEEYYLLDPLQDTVEGWRRRRGRLTPIPRVDGYTSPRLGVTFDLTGPEPRLLRPDGSVFETPQETYLARRMAEKLAAELKAQAARERRRANKAEKLAAQEKERAERLAAKLRELGIDPEQLGEAR